MNKVMKRSLVAVVLLAIAGGAGAEVYHLKKQEKTEQQATAETKSLQTMEARLDQMLTQALENFQRTDINGPTAQNSIRLQDKGDKFLVTANIPGASESDIQVNIDGRILSISSESRSTIHQTENKDKVVHQETFVSSYQNAFTLPAPVNASAMQSEYHDGVLTVTIPKA